MEKRDIRSRLRYGGHALRRRRNVADFFPICHRNANVCYGTGKECGQCHVSVTGGGKLTPFGEKFKANQNKLP
jgi:hypothetical protein